MTEPTLKQRLTGAGFEIGTGVATDALTTAFLLNPVALAASGGMSGLAYAGINGFQGALSNYITQKHIYGEDDIRWGEILASGALNMIPWMDLKAGKNVANIVGGAHTFKRGIVGGAAYGLAGEQLRVGIDDKRFLRLNEVAMAGGFGAGFGAGFTAVGKPIRSRIKSQQLKGKNFFGQDVKRKIPGGQLDELQSINPRTAQSLRMSLNQSLRGWRNRPAPINTLEFDTPKKMLTRMEEVADELGYEAPKNIITIAKKPHIEEGLPTPPIELESIYEAHEIAFWRHLQFRKDADPLFTGNMEVFPDFVHEGYAYRPKTRVNEHGELEYARIISKIKLQQYAQKGKSKRIASLNELNEISGGNIRAVVEKRKSDLDQINAKLESEGKHPIGDVATFKGGGLEADHIAPVELTARYGRGLPKKYKKIVYNAIIEAGGSLGDDPNNIVLITKLINNNKKSYLSYLLKKYNHKPASSFGKDHKARVLYYLTPNPITLLTPIDDYVTAVYKAEMWAADQMEKVFAELPVIKPGLLKELPKDQYNVLMEIFGDEAGVKAFYDKIEDDIQNSIEMFEATLGYSLPDNFDTSKLREAFIEDEIWSRVTGLF